MTGPEKVRLSLDPDLARRGAVDGAWWPASYDAGAELPALIAAIDQHLERRVLRVGLHVDTWGNIPHHIAAPGRQVKVGWFRTIEPHVINLIIPGIEHLNLLVIPPDTTPTAADNALDLATRCRGRTRPGDILAAANQNGPADTTAEQELSLAGWDNEGGQTRQPARGDYAY
ncbi:hypothetical protein ETD86_33900 [Nonomuraea turkmeniaca]|uniref:Uncharacterized protein n=1 Tax=Nonomuraea turkmeniaca TaxID=103838 RepID=A0A5S4F701_9ACTN|nr:DUF5994 family protein [Nonomuraea turkmeniaca]TMR12009.1 hypothetical protein ETD86_33900 [Nonomuraea turkmeniaca]